MGVTVFEGFEAGLQSHENSLVTSVRFSNLSGPFGTGQVSKATLPAPR
jgi:hypothetical protein